MSTSNGADIIKRGIKETDQIFQNENPKTGGLEINSLNIMEGMVIEHPYNIAINRNVVIGMNFTISKGATIGKDFRGRRKGTPVIGNNVYIGANATVIGKITIGDDVLIAPNTFVNIDIPSHSIVIGSPCRIIRKNKATDGFILNLKEWNN